MQLLITHGSLARTRVMHFNRWQLGLALAALIVVLTLLSGTVYHFVFLKAAREGWPVVSQIVRPLVQDEFAQRDRFMRENLDAMAQKVGEMQAKLIKLEAMGDRVSGLVGVKAEELQQLVKPAGAAGGRGGPFIPATSLTLAQLNGIVESLDQETDQRTDLFTMIESRLLEKRLQLLMVPNRWLGVCFITRSLRAAVPKIIRAARRPAVLKGLDGEIRVMVRAAISGDSDANDTWRWPGASRSAHISSEITTRSCSIAISPMASSSSGENTRPVGFWGLHKINISACAARRASSSRSISKRSPSTIGLTATTRFSSSIDSKNGG